MFRQELEIALKLTIDGTAHEVPGAHVRRLDLDMKSWGFEAEVDFWISSDNAEDTLFTPFTGTKLIEVELTVESHAKREGTPPDPFVLKGIVTDRRFAERVFEKIEGKPVNERRYWIRFADPAQVLWGQHYPCDLHVNATMQALVDAHKGAKISITYDWPAFTKQHPILFIGLGAPENPASFYEFLVWFVRQENGVFTYDHATNAYKITGTKAAEGTPKKLSARDVRTLEVRHPEPLRYSVSVLNSYAASAGRQDVANVVGVAGVRHDVLLTTSITAQVDARKELETAKLVQREAELDVDFRRFPTITFRPGTLVDFSAASWSDKVFQKGKTYRVRDVRIRAEAADVGETPREGQTFTLFEIDLTGVLELKDEKWVSLPPFRTPLWPVLIEGKVVSEQGEEADETYQIYTDSNTSVDQYKVKVPLFEDKVVVVDYNPNHFAGHFYFPAFKNERVLLSMEFQRAWIKRFLEWRPGARLPMDKQGNHLLLGKTAKSQTSMIHDYTDNKPILTVKRTLEKDTELIEVSEGRIFLQTKEESE